MNRQQYLLGKLAEECSELAQAALKAQQFGLDSVNPYTLKTNREELESELMDVGGICHMLGEEFNVFSAGDPTEGIENKIIKTNKNYEISKELGFVQ